MKKIIWLSSYPKSGNTFLRTLISSYFFTDDGTFKQELLKKINEYPRDYFKFISNNTLEKEILNWEKILLEINNSSSNFVFLKTHLANCELNKKFRTINDKFSKCIIYIYRDPRNVLSSLKDFFNIDISRAKEYMFNKENMIIHKNKVGESKNFTPILDWESNYKSYKVNEKKIPTLFVKYENLTKDTKYEFSRILTFLKKFINFEINNKKISKCIESTTFKNLKFLEEKEGFIEKKIMANIRSKNPFFNKGIMRNVNQELDINTINIINDKYYDTIRELDYSLDLK